jgi:hypothetical protein
MRGEVGGEPAGSQLRDLFQGARLLEQVRRVPRPYQGAKVLCGSGAPAGNRPSGPAWPRLDVVGWQ